MLSPAQYSRPRKRSLRSSAPSLASLRCRPSSTGTGKASVNLGTCLIVNIAHHVAYVIISRGLNGYITWLLAIHSKRSSRTYNFFLAFSSGKCMIMCLMSMPRPDNSKNYKLSCNYFADRRCLCPWFFPRIATDRYIIVTLIYLKLFRPLNFIYTLQNFNALEAFKNY